MITKVIVLFLLLQTTLCQMDGHFWWTKLNMSVILGKEPPQPKFEEVNEFDTDESDKIIFKTDEHSLLDEQGKNAEKTKLDIKFADATKLTIDNNNNSTHNATGVDITTQKTYLNFDTKESVEDILEFSFPGSKWNSSTINKFILPVAIPPKPNENNTEHDKEVIKKPQLDDKTIYLTGVVPVKVLPFNTNNPTTIVLQDGILTKETKSPNAEPICTYLDEAECHRRKGTVYSHFHTQILACCILPMMSSDRQSRIYFPDEFETLKRSKRSDSAYKQRNAVLRRSYASRFNSFGPRLPTVPPKVATKIVTPSDDDNSDPYWNIKMSQNTNPHQASYQSGQFEYGQEYADYAAELPKPGLVGIYSEYGIKPAQYFPTSNPNTYGVGSVISEEEDEDDGPFFGYSTVDPRKVMKRPTRPKVKPMKIQTSSNEDYSDNESETVQYHSNPDFKVLEGFKLLNLFRNRTKSFNKNTKITTVDFDSEEYPGTRPTPLNTNLDSEYPDFMDINPSNPDCGKMQQLERQSSHNVANGSSPWLALATRTRKPKNVLCYATIVHPRAAVTAAECVHNMSPGEVSIVAGMWDLTEDRGVSQQRLTSVIENPSYVAGKMAHNVAVLQWKVPLRFGATVRAVCMTDPHVGDDCHFLGWGGYDIAMRPRPRRQSATILTPRACKTRLSVNRPGLNLPPDAFCATIDQQATVTGIGGPLTCKINDKTTLVGIAVLRDNVIVLLPVDWAKQTLLDMD